MLEGVCAIRSSTGRVDEVRSGELGQRTIQVLVGVGHCPQMPVGEHAAENRGHPKDRFQVRGKSVHPFDDSPRHVLRTVLARAEALGFTPLVGYELEFHLFAESWPSAQQKGFQDS